MRYDLRALNRAANQALGGRWVEVHHHAANHAKFGPRASNSRTSRCCVSCAPSNAQRVSCNSSIRRRRALVASLRCRRSRPSCLIGCTLRRPRWTARWRPDEPRWLHPWLQRSPDWRSFAGPNRVAAGQRWWRRRDLNPQPPPCKGGALPVELRPRGAATRVPAAGCAEISDGSLCLLWTERWMTRWTTR